MQNVYLNTQTQPAHPQPLLHLIFSSASISFEGQKNALGAEQALNQGMYCRSYFSQTQLKFSQQSSEFKERKEQIWDISGKENPNQKQAAFLLMKTYFSPIQSQQTATVAALRNTDPAMWPLAQFYFLLSHRLRRAGMSIWTLRYLILNGPR